MKNLSISLISSLALLAFSAQAKADISVDNAWVRATVPGKTATGAFMTLKSDKATQLVGGTSPVAGLVEVHEMLMEGDIMKMRAIPALKLPANTPVELKPGSYHVMLMKLKTALREGETVPIKLEFVDASKNKETIEIKAAVKPLTEKSGHEHHQH